MTLSLREDQAIGRIRRYGQKKDVRVWRFLVHDTIDVEIIKENTHTVIGPKFIHDLANAEGGSAGGEGSCSASECSSVPRPKLDILRALASAPSTQSAARSSRMSEMLVRAFC